MIPEVTISGSSSSISPSKPYTINLPWVEKYRPATLDELVSHTDIINTIRKFVDRQQLPHLLFYGPPGTGKTSTILAVARTMFSPAEFNAMVLELNASDDRGIGIVRGQILNFASTRTIFKHKHKLIILDEADAMTNDAQNALRRVIEKYARNVRFCIIANYLGKITPAIQSRCTRFRFGPLLSKQILPRLEYVIEQEGLSVSEEGKKALLRLGEGDMRKVLNILQCTALAFSITSDPNSPSDATTITDQHVYLCTGAPIPSDIEEITNWMLSDDITTAFNNINQLKTFKGYAVTDILTEVHKFIARIDFPPNVRIFLLIGMAKLERRLAIGGNDKIHLGALVALFHTARNMVTDDPDGN